MSGAQKSSQDKNDYFFLLPNTFEAHFVRPHNKCCQDYSFLLWKTILWARFPGAYQFHSILGTCVNLVQQDDRHEDRCLERRLCFSSQEEVSCHTIWTTRGCTSVGQKAEGMRGKCAPDLLLWFLWDRIIFTRLWEIGVVPCCQVLGDLGQRNSVLDCRIKGG